MFKYSVDNTRMNVPIYGRRAIFRCFGDLVLLVLAIVRAVDVSPNLKCLAYGMELFLQATII